MTMSEDLTELERAILPLIVRQGHRPRAITRVLRRRGLPYDHNDVVQALSSLEEKGLVERASTKSWLARDKAQDYISS